MLTLKSIALFLLAALAEIGGAWLVWQGVREHRGWIWIGAGVIALGLYGFVATLQADANFGRILAAYGGVFVAGSLIQWLSGQAFDFVGGAAKGTLPFLMYPNGENASGRFDELAPDSFKYTIAAREIKA